MTPRTDRFTLTRLARLQASIEMELKTTTAKKKPAPAIDLADLGMTIRTTNCLRAEGIHTLRDIVSRKEIDLLKLPNFGRHCLNEVRAVLQERGYSIPIR